MQRLALMLLLFGMSSSLLRADDWGRLDPSQSLAEFSLRVLWLRKLDGRFEFIQGGVTRSLTPERINIDVQIASQSLAMHDPKHARWAQSDEFFASETYPWIRFSAHDTPERLLHEGGWISGTLSLRGISRPAEFELLPARCERPGLDCAVEARGVINRSDFGMTARRWAVSDRVQLALRFRLRADGDS